MKALKTVLTKQTVASSRAPLPVPHPRAKRVGLLGGSFNPAHRGHLHISREAMKRLGLNELWWMVSPQNLLKQEDGMAPFQDRLAGADRVARLDRRIRVTGVEAVMGTRATIDTMAGLSHRFPKTVFIWLMGADNLIQIPEWRRWEEIFNHTHIAVLTRPTYDSKALLGKAARRFSRARLPPSAASRLGMQAPPAWVFLSFKGDSASATAIRNAKSL